MIGTTSAGVRTKRTSALARRFPPPWSVEAIDGGFKIVDSNGQALAYVYGHADERDAGSASVVRPFWNESRSRAVLTASASSAQAVATRLNLPRVPASRQ
jgi:hypothetical protein